MCQNCVEQGVMTQEQLEAAETALGKMSDGPESLGEILANIFGDGKTPIQKSLEARISNSAEAAGMVTDAYNSLMQDAGWEVAMATEEDTGDNPGRVAVVYIHPAFEQSIVLAILPESLAATMREILRKNPDGHKG